VASYEPPPNVVSADGRDLGELLRSGDLAASIGTDGFEPLIADATEAGYRALAERGHYPINHLVVVKDEHLADAPAIYDAFERARDLYVRSGELEPMHARVAEITGRDPLPYGVEENRATIDELIAHALRQKILRERPDVDSLFARV
jgi:4,5-dihydroxyphthalate decarboxylase